MSPDVQVSVVTTGGMVIVALVGVAIEILRRQSSALEEVRDQVSNTHDTNLRDDLDRVITGLDTVLDRQADHATEIGILRTEVRHERLERLSVSERLDDHLADGTRRAVSNAA